MKIANGKYFSKNLFWDADLEDLDIDRHRVYVVGRVLDYGKWADWQFIKNYYGPEEIKNTAKRIRTMFPQSLSFIAAMTKTPEKEFRAYGYLKEKRTNIYTYRKEKFAVDDIFHVVRSLTYFADAEEEPLPKMFVAFNWKTAKKKIKTTVAKLQ